MLSIDTNTMLIGLTRGDSVSIVFGAVDSAGNAWNPTSTADKLTFSVAKKWGAEPLMVVTNTNSGNPYSEVDIDQDTFDADKTKYYTESGGVYTQCLDTDSYDANETYYVKDYPLFWTINITKNDWLEKDADGNVILDADGNGTDLFKFADYVYDVQVLTSTGADTIIGKTDDITPTFRVWGEASKE